MRKHYELKAWQEAMELVKEIYRVTRDFPKEEIYGLVSQMRRAAVSIPSNISEGAARGGDREFIQFLIIARGSLSELETQLLTPHPKEVKNECLEARSIDGDLATSGDNRRRYDYVQALCDR
ncbi:MAG: hypothetical protein CO012_03670 [Syntrophobacterales bacterium CG_4_8_14_3_um_filter_49_14]|nr:MAG: hypothetical protein CO012_03670 [Syntrophobacterales bacterium CG_4_8_14_3_um_filter_49_14]